MTKLKLAQSRAIEDLETFARGVGPFRIHPPQLEATVENRTISVAHASFLREGWDLASKQSARFTVVELQANSASELIERSDVK